MYEAPPGEAPVTPTPPLRGDLVFLKRNRLMGNAEQGFMSLIKCTASNNHRSQISLTHINIHRFETYLLYDGSGNDF